METQFVRNLERYFQDKSLQTQIDIALNTFNNCRPLNGLNEKYSNNVQSVKSNKISTYQFYGWRNFKILHDLNCENCLAMSQIRYHYFVWFILVNKLCVIFIRLRLYLSQGKSRCARNNKRKGGVRVSSFYERKYISLFPSLFLVGN